MYTKLQRSRPKKSSLVSAVVWTQTCGAAGPDSLPWSADPVIPAVRHVLVFLLARGERFRDALGFIVVLLVASIPIAIEIVRYGPCKSQHFFCFFSGKLAFADLPCSHHLV